MNKTIDDLKQLVRVTQEVSEAGQQDWAMFDEFCGWLIKYKSPEAEASILKDIPNTPENLEKIKLFRKLAVRNMIPMYHREFIDDCSKWKTVYRIKGRGSRKEAILNGHRTASSHLPIKYAETLALYRHFDYV